MKTEAAVTMFGAISRVGSGLLSTKALEKLGLETVKVASVSSANSKSQKIYTKFGVSEAKCVVPWCCIS